jgi:hypothetical protein
MSDATGSLHFRHGPDHPHAQDHLFVSDWSGLEVEIPARKKNVFSPILFCAVVAASPPGWAALGGTPDTVQADPLQMHATRRVAGQTGHEVHELALPSGAVVREFVASSGTVFAVAWQGPCKPDLNPLLGPSSTRLVAEARRPHGDHRMLSVHAADRVVDSGGKMRGFSGRAYLPALVPVSVAVGDIR